MVDEQTRSLWSHILGEARQGDLKGTRLETVPSVITDWATWRAARPDSTVVNLSRTEHQYRRSIYARPSEFVIGMTKNGAVKAWPYDELLQQPVVNDELGGVPLAVFYDACSASALIVSSLTRLFNSCSVN